jgi:hypothetical protein
MSSTVLQLLSVLNVNRTVPRPVGGDVVYATAGINRIQARLPYLKRVALTVVHRSDP